MYLKITERKICPQCILHCCVHCHHVFVSIHDIFQSV